MKKITLMLMVLWLGGFAYGQAPANDVCAGAVPFTPSAAGTGCGTATFTLPFTSDGTTDSGVPQVCSNPGNDQWFTWTATSDALLFNSENPGSPGIAIFASCADADAGVQIDCANTFASDALLFGWNIGDALLIQIYDFNGSSADVAFCLEEATAPVIPANDLCADAITVADGDVVTGDTTAASADGQAFCGTSNTAPGTWYVFNDGGTDVFDVTASLCNSSYDTKISVYSGSCTAPVCVGGNDDACGVQSEFTFTTDGAGTDYYILVHGFGSGAGAYELEITAEVFVNPVTLCDPMTDSGAPVVNCPEDIFVSGDGPNCNDPIAVTYDFSDITDDCTARLAQNTEEMVNDAFDCSGQVTGHLRVFDLAALGIVNNFILTEVEVGIWEAQNSPVMTVNIYDEADLAGGVTAFTPPISGTVTPLATTEITVTNGNQYVLTVPISANLAPNANMVVEVLSPNSADFLIGYNNSGNGIANETTPGYLGCEDAAVSYETPGNLGAQFSGFSAVIIPSGADLEIVQTAGLPSGDLFPAGDTMNTFEVTDVAGNTVMCSFNVNVGDADGPVVDGPVNIFTGTGGSGGACGAVVSYTMPTATDNCAEPSAITMTQTSGLGSGAFFPVGVTTETYEFEDTAGNVTEFTFDVTITDTSDPVIDCPGDFAESPDDTGMFTIPDWTGLASDGCSSGADLEVVQDPVPGTMVADLSVTDVTITATDAAGNTTVCAFMLTIDETLSIDDVTLNSALTLSPNPTSDIVLLKNTSGARLASLVLSDINGRVMRTISLSEMQQEMEISLASFATGVYFATISTGNATTVKRIVKR